FGLIRPATVRDLLQPRRQRRGAEVGRERGESGRRTAPAPVVDRAHRGALARERREPPEQESLLALRLERGGEAGGAAPGARRPPPGAPRGRAARAAGTGEPPRAAPRARRRGGRRRARARPSRR